MYSKLIHTVNHVEGYLRDGFDSLDAFLCHTWAVTVTGNTLLYSSTVQCNVFFLMRLCHHARTKRNRLRVIELKQIGADVNIRHSSLFHYSHVFHTVCSERDYTLCPFLTGAPKVWAIRFIEKMEKSSRNWYGGAVGLIGECVCVSERV